MPEKKLSILVVDDNRVNQLFIRTILEKEGHSVTIAADGRQAFNLFNKEKFDLVFMDIQMPEMDGYDTTAAIRAYEKQEILTPTPIVALTAYTDGPDNERAGESFFNRFLSKPLGARQICEVLYETTGTDTPAAGGEVPREKLSPLELKLLAEFSGSEDTLESMITMAVEDIPSRMDSMEEALSSGDFKKALNDAHSLANIAGVLYCEDERNLALSIEKLLDTGDRETACLRLPKLKEQLETVLESFHALLQGPLAK